MRFRNERRTRGTPTIHHVEQLEIRRLMSISYATSYFGNSWAMASNGEPKWANYLVQDIWVAPDGKTYTGSIWDEAAREIGIYQNGDKVGYFPNTHGEVDGKAITGNVSYLFASSNENDVRRWDRATTSVDGADIATGGQVRGLAADGVNLFVGTDASGGLVKVYQPATQSYVREWAFARPGRMSVDGAGNLWAIQRGDASNAPRIVKFSPTGTQLDVITFASNVVPTDVATDGTTRVLVADGGPDRNVKVYATASLSGTPSTVTDTLGATGGTLSTAGGFAKGQAGAGRFDPPTGVGIDSAGNYYVSTFGGGSTIDSYSSAKERLWRVFGLEFEDVGDIDPTDPNAIYTKDGKYTVNWSNGVGQEATYWGTTEDFVSNPNDPRAWINKNGNNNAGARVITAGGQKFLYVWDQQSGLMQVYRFDGDIAVPAALLCRFGNGVEPRVGNPTSNDPWDMWIWQDTDRDGQFDNNEFTTYRADNPYMYGWNVDAEGNIWKGMRESGIRKLALSVDANGMPTFSPQAVIANPAPFTSATNGDIRRVHYDLATDTMYISGFNSANTSGGPTGTDDRGAGRLMAKYPNWNTGNRTASQTIQLPYNFDTSNLFGNHYTPESIDVAGDYLFVGYFDPGAARVRVYRTSDMSFVDEMTAGRNTGSIYGTDIDTPNGLNAFVRSTGEYVVLHSNYGYGNQLMFRWTPGAVSPVGEKLSGTVIGTTGSWDGVSTRDKAFDGSLATYFNPATMNMTNWAGLDLGAAKNILQVRFAPRAEFADRMLNGRIEASNDPNFASGVAVLHTITAVPVQGMLSTVNVANGNGYRYVRYTGGTQMVNIAELEAWGVAAPAHRWTFDTNAGDSGVNVPITGAPTNGAVAGSTAQARVGIGSLFLDGVNDWVNVSNADLQNSFTDITVTGWFRAASVSGARVIYEEGNSVGGLGVRLNGSTLEARVRGGSTTRTASVPGIVTGTWTFFAVTFTQGDVRLYVNGGTTPDSQVLGANLTVPTHTNGAGIGARNAGDVWAGNTTANFFSGYIDDLRIYDNAALSGAEVDVLSRATGQSSTLRTAASTTVAPSDAPATSEKHAARKPMNRDYSGVPVDRNTGILNSIFGRKMIRRTELGQDDNEDLVNGIGL